MLPKSVFTLIFAVALVSCLKNPKDILNDSLDDSSPYFQQYSKVIKKFGDLSHCNKTQCSNACPGADPLYSCPLVVPTCLSGCACLLDCEHAMTACFETKYCLATLSNFSGSKSNTTEPTD